MSHHLASLRARCLSLLVGALAVSIAAAGQATQADKPVGQIEITRQMTYPAGAAESTQVLEWIKMASPAYAPLLKGGRITVTRQTRLTGMSAQELQARSSALSPLPLPTSGVNGERYNVGHDLPDGSHERWVYEWRGGGSGGGGSWVTVEYEFRKGSGDGDRPSPNPKLR